MMTNSWLSLDSCDIMVAVSLTFGVHVFIYLFFVCTALFQSTVYGMAFALLLLLAKRFKVIDDSKHEALFTRAVSTLVVLLAAGGMTVSAR